MIVTEITLTMRFEGEPPPDLQEVLEEEFDCSITAYIEEQGDE